MVGLVAKLTALLVNMLTHPRHVPCATPTAPHAQLLPLNVHLAPFNLELKVT